MRKVLSAALILFAMLAGEAHAFNTGGTFQKIRPGMSIEQVEKITGNPDGFKASGNQTVYSYLNVLISGWAWDRADYFVVFTDGAVTEVGAGEVRQDPKTGFFFLFVQ